MKIATILVSIIVTACGSEEPTATQAERNTALTANGQVESIEEAPMEVPSASPAPSIQDTPVEEEQVAVNPTETPVEGETSEIPEIAEVTPTPDPGPEIVYFDFEDRYGACDASREGFVIRTSDMVATCTLNEDGNYRWSGYDGRGKIFIDIRDKPADEPSEG
jgi:hypothetical protein